MKPFSPPAHVRLLTLDAQDDGDQDPKKGARNDKASNARKETDIAQQSITTSKRVKHGLQVLDQCHFDNVHRKLSLKFLNIVGSQNAKLGTKRKVLATKMVQPKVNLSTVCKIIDGYTDSSNLNSAFFNELWNKILRMKRNARDHKE